MKTPNRLWWWLTQSWRRRETEADNKKPPCPLCVKLQEWYDPRRPIGRQTHHVGEVGYDMCYEHFKILHVHTWIEGTLYLRT